MGCAANRGRIGGRWRSRVGGDPAAESFKSTTCDWSCLPGTRGVASELPGGHPTGHAAKRARPMKAKTVPKDAAAAHLQARSFSWNDVRAKDLTLPKTRTPCA